MGIEQLLQGVKDFHRDASQLHTAGNHDGALGEIRKLRNSLMEADLGDVPPPWGPQQPPAEEPKPVKDTLQELAHHAGERSAKTIKFLSQDDIEHATHELSLLTGELVDALTAQALPTRATKSEPSEGIPTALANQPPNPDPSKQQDGMARQSK